MLREFGFNSDMIDSIDDCILNFLPSHQQFQKTVEEKVVGDAYVLTYWKIIPDINYKFNFYQSEQIFHNIDK